MDFSEAEKVNGVALRVLVQLQSGMSFSHFGELWPRGRRVSTFIYWIYKSHLEKKICTWEKNTSEPRWAVGIGRLMVGYASC